MNIYLLSMAPGLDLTPWERERFTSFFFYTPANHPYLHSFPTRRSSDLAPGPAGGPSDAFADLSQPGPNRGGINHYFFRDRKSTRLNSSHRCISYAVFCLKKKNMFHAQPYGDVQGLFALVVVHLSGLASL